MARPSSERAALRSAARWQRLKPSDGPKRSPRWRRFQRGQGLIIFAISLAVLMGMVGLAVDALRAYDLYAREHRAAEAGALAGVLYMPNYYSTAYTTSASFNGKPVTSTDSAITRALRLAHADGFGDGSTAPSSCTAPNTSMEVTVCKADPSLGLQSDTALQVTITEPISIFFLSLVGIQSITVSATSAADFIQGLNLGTNDPNDAHSYYWSDGGECNNQPVPPPSCSGGLHDFAASINGPAELKQTGDPFVNCEEGPSQGPLTTAQGGVNGADPSAASSPLFTNASTGFVTNHPQYLSSNCGSANSDQQPNGFTGSQTAFTSHPGAYNFYISAPSTNKYSLWVFNPSFIPTQPSSCNGFQLPDQFEQDLSCSSYYPKYPPVEPTAPGPTASGRFDDPRLFFQVTYSLYSVPVLYDRGGDTPYYANCTPPITSPPLVDCVPQIPYDAMTNDLAAHGCPITNPPTYVYQLPTAPPPATGTCVLGSAPNVNWNGWEKVADDVGPDPIKNQLGIFRLAVEATSYDPWAATDGNMCGLSGGVASGVGFGCGWGIHSYGIKLCPDKYPDPKNVDTCWPGAVPSGTSVRPWNNMDVVLLFNNANLTQQIPLADLPANFAGRTLTFNIFNPGISHGHTGNAYFMILPPAKSDNGTPNPPITISSANYPPWEQSRLQPFPGSVGTGNTSLQTVARTGGNGPGDDIYQGLWTSMTVTLPSGYLGGEWWLDVYHDQGKDFNEFAVSFALNGGSPVHIIF